MDYLGRLWTFLSWVHVCLFIILFLIATLGRRLGLRKRYIELLLKLFQFSQQRVDKGRKPRLPSVSLDESDVIEDINQLSFSQPKYLGVHNDNESGFQLNDILEYVTAGVAAVVDDAVLSHFVPAEPPCWNLLSRNNTRAYEFVSFRLTFLWVVGFLIRYLFLLPTRLLVLAMGMVFLLVCTNIVGALPEGPTKRSLNARFNIFCFDFVASSLSLFATFHNTENRPLAGITVANHTSPIDSMILSTDNVYDMLGQIQGGLLRYFMNLLSRSSTHIWFERSNYKDRSDVARRLQEHTDNPDLPPILVFPEGVCVNNTSVLQFKKGAFEIDTVIYPVAIRFDPRFGDAYWWDDPFFSYVILMMTSWAIVCDVWYLPPVRRQEGETAIAFANRVKATIAQTCGLSDVPIDGCLKLKPPKADLKNQNQLEFSKHCKSFLLQQSQDQFVDTEMETSNRDDNVFTELPRIGPVDWHYDQKIAPDTSSSRDGQSYQLDRKTLDKDNLLNQEIRQRFVFPGSVRQDGRLRQSSANETSDELPTISVNKELSTFSAENVAKSDVESEVTCRSEEISREPRVEKQLLNEADKVVSL